MNIRNIAGLDLNYSEISREERQYTAVLFAALSNPSNSLRFLNKICNCKIETLGPDFGIYYEYSFIRDLWHKIGKSNSLEEANKVKKDIIKNLLAIENIDSILAKSCEEINETFGITNNPSKIHVQSPSRWAIKNYSGNFNNNEDFEKISKFKWSFNIKPDLVVHVDKNTAFCIETKLVSGLASYSTPSYTTENKSGEKKQYKISQLELQEYMMRELLGIDTTLVFISKTKRKIATEGKYNLITTTWEEVFDKLDTSDMMPFAKRLIENLSTS